MWRAIKFVVASAILIAVAWWVSRLPGHVDVDIGAAQFEARLPAAILIVGVLFVALYVMFRVVGALFRSPRRVAFSIRLNRRGAGDRAVTRSLLALAAGDPHDARREAQRARRLLGATPQTLLLVAEASRLAGREGEATEAFRTLTEREDAKFLGYRGLLRQAMEREDWTEAASLARHAEEAHPGAAWLRSERGQLAIRTGNWAEALALADADAPKAALAAAAAEAESDPLVASRLARQAWKESPGNTAAALAYARRLRAEGSERRVQSVLRRAWALSPQPDLANFALALTAAPTDRVTAAQRLTDDNIDHPESRLLLAREMLAANQPVEAGRQAEKARLAGLDQRRLWALRADIEEALGDPAAARDALRRASVAAPDPAWRCTACGTEAPGWAVLCRGCGRVGTLEWSAVKPGPLIQAADHPVANAA
jgi:HemY protein